MYVFVRDLGLWRRGKLISVENNTYLVKVSPKETIQVGEKDIEFPRRLEEK